MQQQEESNKVKMPSFHFQGDKAGMPQDLDEKERIKKIIDEATKDTEYYKRQQEKQEKYNNQIIKMKEHLTKIYQNKNIIQQLNQECQQKIQQIEQSRALDRCWAYFDLDMFFVACEIRENPKLANLPVVVGGGVVSTANYIARKFGIRSAMPTFVAQKLCPQLIILPCNSKLYNENSEIFKNIISKYDEEYESMGCDEASLDLTNYLKAHNIELFSNQVFELCNNIRKEICEETKGLTVSCGIACNKMLAKLCSEENKPNGQYMLQNNKDIILEFLKLKNIRKIPGIGGVAEQFLNGIDVQTCGDLLEKLIDVRIAFDNNQFEFYLESALGIGRNFHEMVDLRKSFSVSKTFGSLTDIKQMKEILKEFSQSLEEDLENEGFIGKNLTLHIKTSKFEVRTKSKQLDRYISKAEEIYQNASDLLNEAKIAEPIRLLGIQISQLILKQEFNNRSIQKYFNQQKPIEENDLINQTPSQFQCFICNNIIDCGGNNQRMNNHISKCMQKQNTQSNIQNSEYKSQKNSTQNKKKSNTPQYYKQMPITQFLQKKKII